MVREEFDKEFETSRKHLKSFLLRLTASAEDAEDIIQDAYIKASEKLSGFRGESTLKTWVFAIATNLARDNARANSRWTENVTDLSKEAAFRNPTFFQESMHIRHTSPHGNFEIKEHIAFCFTCVSKSIPLEQHLALLLKEIYDFKVAEIAMIMKETEAMVKYYLHTARSKMIRIFDGRCALINKQGICHQCSELNGIFNPHQKFEEEALKIEMARESGTKNKEELFDLRMKVLKGLDPFDSDASELQLHHLQHNRAVMEEYLKKTT